MFKFILCIKTVCRLGLWNVSYVAWYRFSLRSGIRKYKFPVKSLETDQDFYLPCDTRPGYPVEWKKLLLEAADRILSGTIRYYAYHWKQAGNPPDWFLNPFSGAHYPDKESHWTRLPDFHPEAGDIKNIWEASRFEWVVTLARAYAVTGKSEYLETLNNWLRDWTENNPLNTGPSWKCGQEASVRVFNLINASYILQQYKQPTDALMNLVDDHLERISGNICYAIAQDNNHGTSEAAGLFIGGSWLFFAAPGKYTSSGIYAKKGRKWLENRVKMLVEEDGGFSQHSVNYHRMMLDTLSFCEFWRQKTVQQSFSQAFYTKAKAATNWLWQLTDQQSGNAPNLGANDGSLLNHLHASPYRDFRPSLNLADMLFFNTCRLPEGLWRETAWWLELAHDLHKSLSPEKDNLVLKSGYVKLKSENSWALLRFPYFRFRPSHNDVFHIDLWYKGKNILCDAGSYSYNPPEDLKELDLKSVQHHNTVMIDGREQMPQLSRFLLGNWLEANETGEIRTGQSGEISWTGSYFDQNKNKHQRTIKTSENTWFIEDLLAGNFIKAVIGFNISDLDCILDGNQLQTSFGVIVIPENAHISVKESFASDYYFEKHAILRLDIEVNQPGIYTTTIILK